MQEWAALAQESAALAQERAGLAEEQLDFQPMKLKNRLGSYTPGELWMMQDRGDIPVMVAKSLLAILSWSLKDTKTSCRSSSCQNQM